MKVVGLVKDLVLSTQIRGACEALGVSYASARNNEKFQVLLADKPDKVIIDLNIEGADPFYAIASVMSFVSENKSMVICFYSHVNTELAEKAGEMGLGEESLYVRSKFFNNLGQIISSN